MIPTYHEILRQAKWNYSRLLWYLCTEMASLLANAEDMPELIKRCKQRYVTNDNWNSSPISGQWTNTKYI